MIASFRETQPCRELYALHADTNRWTLSPSRPPVPLADFKRPKTAPGNSC
jgi:hypothetical protein